MCAMVGIKSRKRQMLHSTALKVKYKYEYEIYALCVYFTSRYSGVQTLSNFMFSPAQVVILMKLN